MRKVFGENTKHGVWFPEIPAKVEKLVNAFPVSTGSGPMVYHYVFKKEFSKTETE
jgi:hypothetical protein